MAAYVQALGEKRQQGNRLERLALNIALEVCIIHNKQIFKLIIGLIMRYWDGYNGYGYLHDFGVWANYHPSRLPVPYFLTHYTLSVQFLPVPYIVLKHSPIVVIWAFKNKFKKSHYFFSVFFDNFKSIIFLYCTYKSDSRENFQTLVCQHKKIKPWLIAYNYFLSKNDKNLLKSMDFFPFFVETMIDPRQSSLKIWKPFPDPESL